MLNKSDVLAARLARAWLDRGVRPGQVSITMQRPVGGGAGWVDLELDVRGSRRALIWVEAKLGHGLSGTDQLNKYKARLSTWQTGVDDKLILLLAPAERADEFPNVTPLEQRTDRRNMGPYFVSWQAVYGILRRREDSRLPGDAEWLRREVLGCMRSEHLEPSELKPRHVTALRHRDEAYAALQAVVERAQSTLRSAGWRPKPNPKKVKDSYWEHRYQPALPGRGVPKGTRAELVWGIDRKWVFAGVYFRRQGMGPVRPAQDERWRLAVDLAADAHGYSEDDSTRNAVWVGDDKTLDLAELVKAGRTVEDQGDDLAKYVDAVFTELVRTRPRLSPAKRDRR